MNVPDAILPDWAQWLAQDADGSWWVYEVCPNQNDTGWYENELGLRARVKIAERTEDWAGSLRRVSKTF